MIKDKINILELSPANEIVSRLEAFGFEAYMVGGCVRDAILNREPSDWDVCTNALPEVVISIFGKENVVETGIKHGTVMVFALGQSFEVTTFRKESGYSDSRHPDSVTFVSDLKEDLSRRDFTINAMAYNKTVGLVDPFSGINDLNENIIRCVGNPSERFSEDALRILRCFRFASRFNFNIDPDTLSAAKKHAPELKNIANERIRVELLKTIVADNPSKYLLSEVLGVFIPEILECVGFDQHSKYHEFDIYNHLMATVDASSPIPEFRMAALLHDIAKPECFSQSEDGEGHFYRHASAGHKLAREILTRLHFSTKEIDSICTAIKYHDMEISENPIERRKQAKRMIAKIGYDNLLVLIDLRKADCIGHGKNAPNHDKSRHSLSKADLFYADVVSVIEEKVPVSVNDLVVNGRDIMTSLEIPQGKHIGVILKRLEDLVVDEIIPNEKSELLRLAEEIYEEINH